MLPMGCLLKNEQGKYYLDEPTREQLGLTDIEYFDKAEDAALYVKESYRQLRTRKNEEKRARRREKYKIMYEENNGKGRVGIE